VQRLQIGWKYKLELSDEFHAHHHHISCITCGATIALHEEAEVESTIAKIADKQGFRLVNHQLELQGICESCQKKHETPTVLPGSSGSLTLPNN
jgi:Fur family ferric uptake transcriptional regulator